MACFDVPHEKSRNAAFRQADETLLDPQSRALIDALEDAVDAPLYYQLTPAELRRAHEEFFFPLSLPERNLVNVEERFIPGLDENKVRIWIYRPKGDEKKALPVMMFCHGGGMMVGSLEVYDSICHRLCERSGVVIVSVDYRLAPENKFPAAHNDALAALKWIHDNASSIGIDNARIAVGGDSGGGLLAAAMTHLARDKKAPPLAFQLLIYPFLGKRRDYNSYATYADGYFGSAPQLNWFLANYLAYPDQLNDSQMCPILADSFENLPPAFILTAGFDMLRDEAEHYAGLLKAANVRTQLRCYRSTFHPFFNAAGVIDVGKTAIDECAAVLRAELQA